MSSIRSGEFENSGRLEGRIRKVFKQDTTEVESMTLRVESITLRRRYH